MNKTQNIKNAVLVVAAGRGHRFGGDLPKQYTLLGALPVLRHTVTALLDHSAIDLVRCVIHPDDKELYARAVQGLDMLSPVMGGDTRQDSVRLGLESLTDHGITNVLVHDAARPFVGDALIDDVLGAIAPQTGAIPALAVADTLKRGQNNTIVTTVDRSHLYQAQTPQGFHFDEILMAHQDLEGHQLTDDASLFEHQGFKVVLTMGSIDNFKITTEEDLMRAERVLNTKRETRIGTGFDAHKFGDGCYVTLCGVDIPHNAGLIGHSDADVALHALTDALLGTIGAGDIGLHFPPSDPQWKGAKSDQFVRHAHKLVHELGGKIINIDITVICEAPKIGPYRDKMIENLVQILNLDKKRISVKATTTEEMGFPGRKEGIAVQTIVSVSLLP